MNSPYQTLTSPALGLLRPTPARSSDATLLKKAQLTGLLETICQVLELTENQFATAKSRYEAVGSWLADPVSPILRAASIYPQGSVALQTTVKPLAREEHDLDLVCLVAGINSAYPPATLKRLIGDRLKANGRYTDIVEEKPRCWRINYANEFHLDITPAIPNPACGNGGELVPDKKLQEWKASNPKGYRQQFEERAALKPQLLLLKAEFAEAWNRVEALPNPTQFKGILRRVVQLAKRHRDQWFSQRNADHAPISIIITTLAARSYEHCVRNNVYETELDVAQDVIRRMPEFIQRVTLGGREYYYVWNETTQGENFAEKWNADPKLAKGFYDWHTEFHAGALSFIEAVGLDSINRDLAYCFGESTVNKAMGIYTGSIGAARANGLLSVTSGLGLSVGPALGVPIKRNTFFGR